MLLSSRNSSRENQVVLQQEHVLNIFMGSPIEFKIIRMLGHDLNLGHLISHRAHRVRREESKMLCDLCGLCERKDKCV
jgi:hypothetical protein